MMMRNLLLACLLAAPGLWPALPAHAQAVNDYPTETRVEYALACMAVNGETPESLRRCSCAIDAIADVLPHDAYVQAETVLRMRQTTGDRSAMFRGSPVMEALVAELHRAEAEADILCF